jgi:hypothetical protein
MRIIRGSSIAVSMTAAAMLACGGSPAGPSTSPSSSTEPASSAALVFHASPVDLGAIRWITPLGNLNPPDHALPTDHIYFYIADPDAGESPAARRTTFYAPADGTVTQTFSSVGGDLKLYIRATSSVNYYIDHLIPDAGIGAGSVLTAGQRVGTTGSVYAVDLGVVNSAVTAPGLLNPVRYNSDTVHSEAPLKYFDEPIRSQLYAKVQRLGSDLDGRVGYDVAGRLVGNWFAEIGSASLSFVYNTYDPSQVRVSVSGRIGSPAVWAIGPEDPSPADVSVASGIVRYALSPSRTGLPFSAAPTQTMLVQMLGDARIQVEMFAVGAAATGVTGNAVTYIR